MALRESPMMKLTEVFDSERALYSMKLNTTVLYQKFEAQRPNRTMIPLSLTYSIIRASGTFTRGRSKWMPSGCHKDLIFKLVDSQSSRDISESTRVTSWLWPGSRVNPFILKRPLTWGATSSQTKGVVILAVTKIVDLLKRLAVSDDSLAVGQVFRVRGEVRRR